MVKMAIDTQAVWERTRDGARGSCLRYPGNAGGAGTCLPCAIGRLGGVQAIHSGGVVSPLAEADEEAFTSSESQIGGHWLPWRLGEWWP